MLIISILFNCISCSIAEEETNAAPNPKLTAVLIPSIESNCIITLHSTSTIHKFIENILIQNKIETKQFNVVMQLDSIEGIKTAVSLGLGAAFVSSSAIDQEIQLNRIEIINIENIKIKRTLSIITNRECYRSKALEFFHKDLYRLKHIKN